jgi:hypothetical protein
MLEQYCFSNDIKLYSITWHANPKLKFNTNDVFSKLSLKTFYYIDYDKMMDELVNGEQDSKYKFYDRARDKKHHGVGYNIYWANFLYKKYLENNDNSRN